MNAPMRLMRFTGAVRRDPEVEAWLDGEPDELGAIAREWFDVMRRCGEDVRELLHDDQPTACVGDVAFAYVDSFTAHVNVGFFAGTRLADPAGLLEGTGRFMRHVKLTPGDQGVDREALRRLIRSAYAHMRSHAGLATDS